MHMMENVTIKGKNFLGFEIEINADDLEEIKKGLDIVIASSVHLIKNSIVTLRFTEDNKQFANDILNYLKGKNIDINAVVVDDKNNLQSSVPVIELKNIHLLSDSHKQQPATYKGNLRNGQEIRVNGDLIIAGNVNPNSYVYATGNIFVLGKLYGIPHAGYGGNNDSMIFAFDLNPPQIRIGNLITRSPEEGVSVKQNNNMVFEVAYAENNSIVISSYDEWLKLKN